MSGQSDQDALAAALRGGSDEARSSAIKVAAAIPPAAVSPALRSALIATLAETGRRRNLAVMAGEPLSRAGDTRSYLRLVRTVAVLHDSASIPALAEALGSGPTAMDALVSFGAGAVSTILDVIEREEPQPAQLRDAIRTLTTILRFTGGTTLARATATRLARVTASLLRAPDSPATLERAIDLAVAERDPRLRATVDSLARDPGAVRARGVHTPEIVKMLQAHAAEALKGESGAR